MWACNLFAGFFEPRLQRQHGLSLLGHGLRRTDAVGPVSARYMLVTLIMSAYDVNNGYALLGFSLPSYRFCIVERLLLLSARLSQGSSCLSSRSRTILVCTRLSSVMFSSERTRAFWSLRNSALNLNVVQTGQAPSAWANTPQVAHTGVASDGFETGIASTVHFEARRLRNRRGMGVVPLLLHLVHAFERSHTLFVLYHNHLGLHHFGASTIGSGVRACLRACV